jgi:hypothetical protein
MAEPPLWQPLRQQSSSPVDPSRYGEQSTTSSFLANVDPTLISATQQNDELGSFDSHIVSVSGEQSSRGHQMETGFVLGQRAIHEDGINFHRSNGGFHGLFSRGDRLRNATRGQLGQLTGLHGQYETK